MQQHHMQFQNEQHGVTRGAGLRKSKQWAAARPGLTSGYTNAHEENPDLDEVEIPDDVAHKLGNAEFVDYEFDPKQYYWLFNPQIKFNRRHGFNLDEDLDPKDFLKMREINRRNLTHFFQKLYKSSQFMISSLSLQSEEA